VNDEESDVGCSAPVPNPERLLSESLPSAYCGVRVHMDADTCRFIIPQLCYKLSAKNLTLL
jgi:hypothetical protein